MADDSGVDLPSTKRKHETDDSSSQQPDTPPKRQRVIGPQLPPVDKSASEDKESPRSGSEDEDDSSDDDFGPALPPAKGGGSSLEANNGRSSWDTDAIHPALSAGESKPSENKVQQRDEWMLNPPDRSSWSINVDPTTLRNRRFATGRAARTSETDRNGMSSKWTETVAEKRQRLENEVMGIETRSESSAQHAPGDRPRQSEKIIAEKVRALNDKRDKTSLYEAHQRNKSRASSEDDPSSRPFDREKDIVAPAKIDSASRREMLKRASDFSSRFSGGRYL
ncbi:hypothetical protein VTN49DRAFT_1535 [Thermomyces lanuginosus]|uniref:uncharacterized protein n=1 Tax=Thermomyces lanuginosus TaxID=5541 RepID=UPI003742D1CB